MEAQQPPEAAPAPDVAPDAVEPPVENLEQAATEAAKSKVDTANADAQKLAEQAKAIKDSDVTAVEALREDSLLKMAQDLTEDPKEKKLLEKNFLAASGYAIKQEGIANDAQPEEKTKLSKENLSRVGEHAQVFALIMFATKIVQLARRQMGGETGVQGTSGTEGLSATPQTPEQTARLAQVGKALEGQSVNTVAGMVVRTSVDLQGRPVIEFQFANPESGARAAAALQQEFPGNASLFSKTEKAIQVATDRLDEQLAARITDVLEKTTDNSTGEAPTGEVDAEQGQEGRSLAKDATVGEVRKDTDGNYWTKLDGGMWGSFNDPGAKMTSDSGFSGTQWGDSLMQEKTAEIVRKFPLASAAEVGEKRTDAKGVTWEKMGTSQWQSPENAGLTWGDSLMDQQTVKVLPKEVAATPAASTDASAAAPAAPTTPVNPVSGDQEIRLQPGGY